MSREDPQFRIRLPVDLKEKIQESAALGKRSINAQIVAVLEEYYEETETLRDCITITLSNDSFNGSEMVREAFHNLLDALAEFNKKPK